MPLEIIRQDITKIPCDAIVNPSNPRLYPGGGTDAAIHAAAGPKLLEACRDLAPCPIGETRISPAFDLPCRFVIHTAGPTWQGGNMGEAEQLASCYRSCLKSAVENKCETVAFPLISSGLYGFPKDKVMKIAMTTISEFLFDHELDVSLVVYDRESFTLSEKLFSGIEEYIDDNYVFARKRLARRRRDEIGYSEALRFESASIQAAPPMTAAAPMAEKAAAPKAPKARSLKDYIKLDKPFAYKLYDLIKAKGISSTQCYKKANVRKQTWYKIETDPHYKPSKKTVISFAIALELSLKETQDLLESVGFILSGSSLFDVIIMYCIENKVYDVFEIDSILFKYDQETLFSKG